MLKKLGYIFNRKDKWKLAGLLFMIIIGSFLELTGVAAFMPFIKVITDVKVIKENPYLLYFYDLFHLTSPEQFLAVMAVAISLVYILKNGYMIVLQNCILKFAYVNRKNICVRLLTTYMEEPYTFHLSRNSAELQRSLQVDAYNFMLLVNNSLQLVAEAVVCLVLGIYLFDTSHSITGIVLLLIVLCMGTFLYISKKISHRIGKQNQVYQGKLFQWVNQSLGGIKEVKVLSREDYFINAYSENYEKLIKGAKNNELLSAVPKYIVEAVCMTGLLVAIIIKMFWGYKGNTVMDFIPQLAVLAVGAFRLLPSVGKINAFANNILYNLPSLELIYDDLKSIDHNKKTTSDKLSSQQENGDDDGSASSQTAAGGGTVCAAGPSGRKAVQIVPTGPAASVTNNDIQVSNVVYHYPDSDENVISGADLMIKGGTTIALIGSSGAGKTTLADIILGLLTPDEGKVLYGGLDIFGNMGYWHSKLGYIPQSIYLSDDSILNNVAFGIAEDKIDEEAVNEALKKAQLYDFVQSLPEGLQTFVGDRGVRLSGGQRQRIGIARALYHDPEILVLDEATAALDNDTEAAVMEAIDSLKGKKTLILIAHRLSTIRNADVIYEVADGKVIERTKESVFDEISGQKEDSED